MASPQRPWQPTGTGERRVRSGADQHMPVTAPSPTSQWVRRRRGAAPLGCGAAGVRRELGCGAAGVRRELGCGAAGVRREVEALRGPGAGRAGMRGAIRQGGRTCAARAGAHMQRGGALSRAPPRQHVTPGYQACTFILPDRLTNPDRLPISGQAHHRGATYLGTPPAAGRAWVPGCRARTSLARDTFLRRISLLGKPST